MDRERELTDESFYETLNRVRPYTMVTDASLLDLAHQVRYVLEERIPGNFVECGVWRGGSSFLMAELLRLAGAAERKVWLCDSFEGIPPPEEIDGAAAARWASDTESPWYQDNLRVSLEAVSGAATSLGLAGYTEYLKGYFDQTLQPSREAIGPIAILRVDCDWYSSVKCCLDSLFDQVVDGGFVIFDDYYTYDGCAVAVHEFLGLRKLGFRLEGRAADHLGYYHSAVFRKGDVTWRWAAQLDRTAREIRTHVGPDELLILADEGQFGDGFPSQRRSLPMMEHQGQYWGPPADADAAIREIERQREAGAACLFFAWPAFWWLEHYPGFQAYLESHYPCVLKNERLIGFRLEPLAGA